VKTAYKRIKMKNIIEIENLHFSYPADEGEKPVEVLKGINLEIKEGEFMAAAAYIYTPVNKETPNAVVDWYYYWDGMSGSICNESGNIIKTNASADTLARWNEKLGDSIKRIVTDDMVYKIYVKDYQVQSVVCSTSERSRFIGAHPVTITQLSGRSGVTSSDIDALENTNVAAVNPNWFDLDESNDGVSADDEGEEETT